jgi:Zn-dependent protease
MDDSLNEVMQNIAVWTLPIIFALTFHEIAHVWMAKRYGDNTAYAQANLGLNPLHYIDIIGTIIVPLVCLLAGGFIIGWAKPTPIRERNFKNPRRDSAIVAAAGPMANLIMALLWALIARVAVMVDIDMITAPLTSMSVAGISINVVLALLNLIPLPPLDGSKVVSAMMSHNMAYKYNQLEPYGFYILLALMLLGVLGLMLSFPMGVLNGLFYGIAGL